MTSSRPTRALVALAVPALTVSALAVPAGAAPVEGPDTPTVAQVATIYPQLAEGSADVERGPVPSLAEDCEDGEEVPGARSSFATYEGADPTDSESFEETPLVFIGAITFRSVRDAAAYVRASKRLATKCLSRGHSRTTIKKIHFRLGDQRVGHTLTSRIMQRTVVSQLLLVRDGKVVALTSLTSLDTPAPAVAKAVELTALTLKTAR